MSCPIGGIVVGGQPKVKNGKFASNMTDAIYGIEQQLLKPTSNGNGDLCSLYQAFLGKPNAGMAQKFLHISYEVQTTEYMAQRRKMEATKIVKLVVVVIAVATFGAGMRIIEKNTEIKISFIEAFLIGANYFICK
jgi:hypothetical protein